MMDFKQEGNHTPMTAQLSKFASVISLKDIPIDQVTACRDLIVGWCKVECKLFGLIIHDKDIGEDGVLKTPHIHLIGVLKSRKRKSTIINALGKVSNLNNFAVSVEMASSFDSCFQYLVHKNDKDKFQYPLSAVVTNLEEEEIEVIMESSPTGIDFERVRSICLTSDSLLGVIEQVGLSTYQHYRPAIIDIFNLVQEGKLHG